MIISKNVFLKVILLLTLIILLAPKTYGSSTDEEKYKYLDLFGQVFDRVRSSYVEEVTDQELIEKAIDGMLSGLDPHSGFMNEEVFQEMQMDTEGKFGGLGIEITMEEGFVSYNTIGSPEFEPIPKKAPNDVGPVNKFPVLSNIFTLELTA